MPIGTDKSTGIVEPMQKMQTCINLMNLLSIPPFRLFLYKSGNITYDNDGTSAKLAPKTQ